MNLKEYGVKPSDNDQEDSRQEDKDNPGVLESRNENDNKVDRVKSPPLRISKSGQANKRVAKSEVGKGDKFTG